MVGEIERVIGGEVMMELVDGVLSVCLKRLGIEIREEGLEREGESAADFEHGDGDEMEVGGGEFDIEIVEGAFQILRGAQVLVGEGPRFEDAGVHVVLNVGLVLEHDSGDFPVGQPVLLFAPQLVLPDHDPHDALHPHDLPSPLHLQQHVRLPVVLDQVARQAHQLRSALAPKGLPIINIVDLVYLYLNTFIVG